MIAKRILLAVSAVLGLLISVLLLAQPAPAVAAVQKPLDATPEAIPAQGAYGDRGKVYWTELGKIRRANLDGTGAEVLVSGLSEPGSIALDLTAGKMYWTDDRAKKIQRANLNGAGVQTLLTSAHGLEDPVGIALDASAGKMYWIDRSKKIIQSADLNGDRVRTLINLGSNSHPYQLAVDVRSKKIYWNDREAKKIRRANLDGTKVEDVITSAVGDPMGIVLDAGESRIYWTAREEGKIRSAKLDRSDAKVLVPWGANALSGIALDTTTRKLYFTYHAGSWHGILLVNTYGDGLGILIATGEGTRPEGIAVAPILGEPADLTAAQGDRRGEVTLSWKPGANATVYWVQYKKDGDKWEPWRRDLSGSTSRVTVPGLQPGQKYWFAVKAGRVSSSNYVWSAWTPVVSVMVGGVEQVEPPGSPANLKAKLGTNAGEVILDWKPGANATVHVVAYKKHGGKKWYRWPSRPAGNDSQITLTGLEPGRKYWFGVRAGRGTPGSEVWSPKWSNVVSATAGQRQRLGNPTNLTAETGVDAGQVILRWKPGANATVHEVALRKQGENWDDRRRRFAGDASGATITGLDAGMTYWFSVRAGRGSSASMEWSRWWRDNNGFPSATAGVHRRPSSSSDRAALVAFYNATGGPNWDNLFGGTNKWNTDAPISQWHGVTTDGSGQVTKLNLAFNNLSGALPPELDRLANLTHLDLSGNNLSGALPPELDRLANLTHLDLSGNNLSGALPPELDRLANLTHLDLSFNAFRGDISSQNPGHNRGIDWQNLSKLTHLDLSYNKRCGALGCRHGLSGSVPVALTIDTYDFFPNLVYLDLSGNELNGGAQALLEKSYTSPDASDEPIIVANLSNNPWAYEPAEHRAYWNEFHGEIMRGFVDLTKKSIQQKYGIPSPDQESLKNYLAGKGMKRIEGRAVKHIAQSGKYANSATWIVRGR